jgi:hypothetical protein
MGFQVFYAKVLSYELKAVAFAPSRDVVALLTDEDSIIIKRVAQKPQRVAVVEEVLKPRSMSLEPEGALLAVGSDEGGLKVYQVLSNHTELLVQLPLFTSPLSHLSWSVSSTTKLGDFPEGSRLVPSASSSSSVMKHTGAPGKVSVLIAADSQATVSLLMDGVLPFVSLDLAACFGGEVRLRSVRLSPDFWELHALVESAQGLEWGVLDSSLLAVRPAELQQVCHLHSGISELLKHLTRSCKSLLKDWTVLSNFFKSRFVLGLEDHLLSCGAKTPARDVLFHCCATGLMATGLTHFLREEIHSVKVLVQFEDKLKLFVKNFHVSAIETLLHPAERLAYYCSQLRICSLNQQKYTTFGVFESQCDRLMRLSAALFAKANQILAQSSKAQHSIHNFLVWVHYLAFKHTKPEEGAEPNSFTNAELDVTLLLEFLESPSAFSLDSVKLSLLDKTPVEMAPELNFTPKPLPSGSCDSLLTALDDELRLATSTMQAEIPKFIQLKSRQVLIRQSDQAGLDWAGEATVAVIVSEGSYILLARRLEGESSYVSFNAEARVTSAFMYGASSLLVLTAAQGGTELLQAAIDTDDWAATPGRAKGLKVQKRLAFEGEELTLAEANAGRGLLSLVLNDRHLKLIDLEDSA